MKKHDDAAEDKAMLKKAMAKVMPKHKIASHLKEDIGESKKSIKKDKGLIKSIGKGYK